MWGYPIEFWQSVFRHATAVAFIFGTIGLAAAFLSAWIGYEIADVTQIEANIRIAEAKTEGDKARKQAEDAKLETQRLKQQMAPRRLSLDQFEQLVEALKPHPSQVDFRYASGDPEVIVFANELRTAFAKAKWQVKGKAIISTKVPFGITVFGKDANVLHDAFRGAGLHFQIGSEGGNWSVMIGNKPPSFGAVEDDVAGDTESGR